MRALFKLEKEIVSEKPDRELTGDMTCTLMGIQRGSRPISVAFQNVTIKQQWLQFPAGQKFRQIELNQNNVAYFNIEGKERHLFDLPGWNFLGSWHMKIGNHTYSAMFGGHDHAIGYNCGEVYLTYTGFFCSNIMCNEASTLFAPETELKSVNIDLVNGVFSGSTAQDDSFNFQFQLTFELRLESIPNSFLDEALAMGMIGKNEYERGRSRKFEVSLPPHFNSPLGSLTSVHSTEPVAKKVRRKRTKK